MTISINFWAVLLAAASSMVVGSIWYMPNVFGKTWAKLSGTKLEQMGKGKPAEIVWVYGSVFVASLVTAYILAAVTFLAQQFTGDTYMQDALTIGLWLWLGFTAARVYVHDLFEMRRKKLTLLNMANELVTVMVMAAILGWLHP